MELMMKINSDAMVTDKILKQALSSVRSPTDAVRELARMSREEPLLFEFATRGMQEFKSQLENSGAPNGLPEHVEVMLQIFMARTWSSLRLGHYALWEDVAGFKNIDTKSSKKATKPGSTTPGTQEGQK